MKTGRSLEALAREITRQAEAKRDFVATTPAMSMTLYTRSSRGIDTQVPRLALGGNYFNVNEIAHDQLSTYTGIPGRYYDRMRTEQPMLFAENVNTWLHANPDKRLVRTMDNTVRAILSDSYRPLEHVDLAEAVLPALLDLKLEIISAEITERRLYLKAVDHSINRHIPKGARMGDGSHHIFNTCAPAIIISNSEVGLGMLSIESGVWTRACTNLAVFASQAMKRRHVGARHELVASDTIMELLSDETRAATDKAMWLQVRDVIKGAFNEAHFEAQIAKIAGTVTQMIEADPVKVVDFTAKRYGMTDSERGSVLKHLITGADLSRYGLFNAITRTAEDLPSYDRAYDFERLGGQIIELPTSQWREIANADGPAIKIAA